jgi:hydroxylaminobenzene mutase
LATSLQQPNNGKIMSVQKSAKQILLHGLAFVLVGLVWGLVVPHTPYPRLALTAHVQFESNGMLIIILAVLLIRFPHRVGSRSAFVMLLAVWLTWTMALSEAANAWWGTTQMLPIAAGQAGAKGGAAWQEAVIKITHISAGLALIVAWTLLLAGFVKDTDADILAK